MPAHVVVGHLVVIVAPLVAVLALVYAARPVVRSATRWPLLVGAAVAFGLVLWAGEAGGALLERLQASGPLPPAVDAHAHGSDALATSVFVLLAVVASLVWRPLAPGREPGRTSGRVAAAVLVLSSVAVLVTTATTLVQAMDAVWAQHPGWS